MSRTKAILNNAIVLYFGKETLPLWSVESELWRDLRSSLILQVYHVGSVGLKACTPIHADRLHLKFVPVHLDN